MSSFKMTPDEIASRLTESIGTELEKIILEKLKHQTEPILREIAHDLAASIKANVHGYYAPDGLGTTKMLLVFNSEPTKEI